MSRLPLLSQVVDLASAYYGSRDSSSVFPQVTPEKLRQAFGAGAPMPESGQDAEESPRRAGAIGGTRPCRAYRAALFPS